MFFMLQQVVGFDSVDDESQGTNSTLSYYPSPEDWDSETNPPYSYWMYHMYANIRSLNAIRRARGLNTFAYRPHCGEAGNASHLVSGFMLADGVCHGVKLEETPVLQYLFYLAQVGIAVSPLSNDILFIPLSQSPFASFFRRGLNVSLSTDDPLIIHLTEEPLIEEYVVAARVFKLSICDLCEIARNSVLQSGFEMLFKEWWIGKPQSKMGPTSADMLDVVQERANVPGIRLQFREQCLAGEMMVLQQASSESCLPCR
jgi:AMP deaminase